MADYGVRRCCREYTHTHTHSHPCLSRGWLFWRSPVKVLQHKRDTGGVDDVVYPASFGALVEELKKKRLSLTGCWPQGRLIRLSWMPADTFLLVVVTVLVV